MYRYAVVLLLLPLLLQAGILDCHLWIDPLDFGTQDQLYRQSAEITTQLHIHCVNDPATGGGHYRVVFDYGAAQHPFTSSRQINGQRGGIAYNLYRDPSHIQVLGDGTAGTTILTGHSGSAAEYRNRYTLYGRIFATSDYQEGIYLDHLTVRLSY